MESGKNGSRRGFVSKKILSRRDFLAMSGASAAGAALLGVARPLLALEGTAVSAASLGIAPGNTAAQNREALVRGLKNSNSSVAFPPGDYLIDNTGSPAVIENFGGKLTMEPGARFVFTDNAAKGMTFRGGVGAEISGLTATFVSPPPQRILGEECVLFAQCTDTVVRNVDVDGSAAAGLCFSACVRPLLDEAVIKNPRADGVHIRNCQDAKISNVSTENTGDDGVAFLNYSGMPDYSGGLATGITVKNSGTRGITVVGQRDVTVQNFYVDGTVGPGIYCAQEQVAYDMRLPSNVTFIGGTVSRAGQVSTQQANKFGIEFYNVESVKFKDIKVIGPASRGVSGVARGGTVRLNNIQVQGAPGAGFHLAAGTLYLYGLTARDTGSTGIIVRDSGLVRYGTLRSVNASRNDVARRGFSFVDNSRVEGGELRLLDTQATPTGYTVYTYGAQTGWLGNIYDLVDNGSVRMQNRSGLAISSIS